MTWVTQLAQTYGNMTDWIEDAVNGINKVLTDAGWTVHDALDVTSGQTDRVYKSTGEAGNEALYFRMIQVTATQKVRFRLYTLWDATGHTGYNEVKNDGDYPLTISTDNAAFTGWIVANKDGITLAWKHSDKYNCCYIGKPDTIAIAANKAGKTTLTAGVTVAASGSTALAVASEVNIQIGQKVRVLNQTAGANGGNFVRCTVTATGTGTVTVTNDSATATTFDSGALVAYDPSPIMMLGSSYNRSAPTHIGCLPVGGAYFVYGRDTLRMIGSAIALANFKQYAALTPQSVAWATNSIVAGGTPAERWNSTTADAWIKQDPGVEGEYVVYPIILIGGLSNNADNTDEGVRASHTRIAVVTRGVVLSSEDVLEVGTTRWLCMFGDSSYLLTWGNTVIKTVE